MSRPRRRSWWLVSLLGLLAIGGEPTSGQNPPRTNAPTWASPTSLLDPRLEPLRLASASWELRTGPERTVIDQVCLVPDLSTFFEAISAWDQGHWFPILFDDVESSFRFIRAFKPARIVRHPKAAGAIPPEKLWERAIRAVGASWTVEANPSAYKPPGDSVPKGLGPTPPGVVLSSPTAPMLAGAVALAAGRFQPLVRLDSDKHYADILSLDQCEAFDHELSDKIRQVVPNLDRFGDECDFMTVAGDWPYRYRDAKGELDAVDDRLGRSPGSDQRWAYAGRLLGNPEESVYRAMCSLFLRPDSALMFNGYDEKAPPWSDYTMRTAAARFSMMMPTSHVAGERPANLDGWHEVFDPFNRFGLVLINSHGSPTVFNIRGGPASTPDIPRSVPSTVLMIHSYSASDPTDPSTIAGRWLANGAFVFFGSMNEPFLNSFRTPRLVGDLIGERLPIVAAVRASLAEPFGQPWRLVYLGDPLYRIRPLKTADEPRVVHWPPTADWPAYSDSSRPADGSDVDLFLWALKTAIARFQRALANGSTSDDIADALLSIRRGRLPAEFRPVYDALLTEMLLQGRRRSALKARLLALPEAERTSADRRTLETLLAIDLNLALNSGDASRSRSIWSEVMKSDAPRDFKVQATDRVGRLADSPIRRHDWSILLRETLGNRPRPADAEIIVTELTRVDQALKADR